MRRKDKELRRKDEEGLRRKDNGGGLRRRKDSKLSYRRRIAQTTSLNFSIFDYVFCTLPYTILLRAHQHLFGSPCTRLENEAGVPSLHTAQSAL